MDHISDAAVQAARDLRVVFSRLRRRIREVAQDADLTPSQESALSLAGKHGAATASALAAAEGVRPQSMATTLAALEQHGLIRRTPDPDDGNLDDYVFPPKTGVTDKAATAALILLLLCSGGAVLLRRKDEDEMDIPQ